MSSAYLRITSVPAGEAPLWVREKWVGVHLPLAQAQAAPQSFLTSGVVSGPKNFFSCIAALLAGKLERQSGFLVEASVAVNVLSVSSPEAAAWWRDNVPHQLRPKRYFVFQQGVGYVSEGSA